MRCNAGEETGAPEHDVKELPSLSDGRPMEVIKITLSLVNTGQKFGEILRVVLHWNFLLPTSFFL
jgi:hypothetical protein